MGMPEEMDATIAALREVFDVVSVDGPYLNRARGNLSEDRRVRAYVQVRPRPTVNTTMRVWAVRADRPEVEVDAPKQIG